MSVVICLFVRERGGQVVKTSFTILMEGNKRMKQGNGSELFGWDDPRSSTIGIIEVAPGDDRQRILAAIFTQEKLQREQILIVLPEQSHAFRRLDEFEEVLETLKTRHTQLVFVLSSESRFIKAAREHQFPVFTSLEEYARSVQNLPVVPSIEQVPSIDATTLSSPEEAQLAVPTAAEQEAEQKNAFPGASGGVLIANNAFHEPSASLPSKEEEQIGATPVATRERQSPQDIEPLLLDPPVAPLPALIPSIPKDAQKSENVHRSNRARKPRSPSALMLSTPPKGRRSFLPIVIIVVFVLLVGGSILSVLTGLGPLAQVRPFTATIAITPTDQVLRQRYQFVALTETADPAKQQVQARFLSSTTLSRTQTVKSSGIGNIPARAAQGTLTFYNALTQEQTIPAGTVLNDKNGVQLSTDQTVTIPGATPPTEGTIAVTMHALTPGERGNIAAFDFTAFACCRAGVTVTNTQSFSGGADQMSYSYLQQADIDTTAQALQTSLAQLGTRAVQAQILPEDQMLNPVQCVPKVVSDHLAGERVPSATVTETVQCLTEVYNRQNVQSLATNLLLMVGQKNLGAQYALTGPITTKMLTVAHPDNKGATALQMTVQGVWRYQVDDAQKRELATLVAGKKKDEAKALLLRQPGVHDVGIMLSRIASSTLPTNPHSIAIQIQAS